MYVRTFARTCHTRQFGLFETRGCGSRKESGQWADTGVFEVLVFMITKQGLRRIMAKLSIRWFCRF